MTYRKHIIFNLFFPWRYGSVLLLLLVFFSVQFVRADEQAIPLEIVAEPVQVVRIGTANWINLPQGAITPIGPGDILLTGTTGRAQLTLSGGTEILVLGNSTFKVNTHWLNDEDGKLSFAADMTGTMVQQTASESVFDMFRLQGESLVIHQPAETFAMWTNPSVLPAMTVTSGVAGISDEGNDFEVSAGFGYYNQAIYEMDAPYNGIQLAASIDGCPALVTASGAIKARQGPGRGFVEMGGRAEGDTVYLFGTTESGEWFRVQHLNDFSWMVGSGLEYSCDNLPIYADNTLEIPNQVLNPGNDELTLLEPFFGSPATQGFFFTFEN